jgi:immunoglobulin-binding protein 1
VFGPGHNLPTMSIDEYLQIERERGNILSGGGYVFSSIDHSLFLLRTHVRPASEAEPTSSEQLTIDAEMDGTTKGEEKAGEKRLKDENWARFTDENPRGSGNTMNRG